MQTNETTNDERGQMPVDASNPSPSGAAMPQMNEEDEHEGGAYTAEEEALVEERLKNLGYL